MTAMLCYCGKETTRTDQICDTCTDWVGKYLSLKETLKRKKIITSLPTTKINIQTKEETNDS